LETYPTGTTTTPPSPPAIFGRKKRDIMAFA
jgi:hypothetical protein